LNHGGRLNSAAQEYNIPVEDWIDLSTGINPEHWPIPELPSVCFSRLPETDDGLIGAAQQYYQADNLLPVAGSQAAIQLLPLLRGKSRVAVPEIGYAEHAYQWKKSGHELVFYQTPDIEKIINDIDVLILINPNNPTGETYTREQSLRWHQVLQSQQGWLIVDEAFIDCNEANSLVSFSQQPGLIVLRSIGKFFGLAGVRSGFVFAEQTLLEEMNEKLGQWALSGISRYLTKKALLDTTWQQKNRVLLSRSSEMLHDLIVQKSGLTPSGTTLFKTLMHPQAEYIFELFAQQGVLIRLLDNKQGVRFGLPKKEEWLLIRSIFEQVFKRINKAEEIEKRKLA